MGFPAKELPVAFSRLFARPLFAAVIVSLAAPTAIESHAQAAVPSENLLPATTKGFISTHDVNEVRKKFNETQLGEMAADPLMQPFIEDFKKQIGAKLERAGRKLGIKWADMEDVYGGEVSAALIQPDPKDKNSHALVLIINIAGKRKEADELLKKIESNQRANKAVKSALKDRDSGVEITVYTQAPRAGEKAPEKTFYFISGDQIVFSDHQPTVTGIIRRLDGKAADTLASVVAFQESLKKCADAASGTRHHVRWFMEPFGYIEASRASQGGRKRRGTDLLKVLQGQGFTAIQGLGGHIFFNTDGVEVLHRTYVYAPPVQRAPNDKSTDKYNLAMRMLNFPNSANAADLEPQPWTLPDIATYLSFNWKMRQAFDYAETLVDAWIGDKGAFKEIWLNLKSDPGGPQIDIYKELLDHLGERATLLTDVKLPVELKSERLLALIEVKDAAAVAKTVEKAFAKDPQAKKHTFENQIIWEITQEESLAGDTELMIEGAGFVSTSEAAPAEKDAADEEAKFPNMAITVYLNHLIVSTHLDFIEDFIKHQAAPAGLGNQPDYQRVQPALVKLGSAHDSFRFFSRTDESYRATYELLKQGKLPEAETLLARLLNAMLGSREEGAVRQQEIDGSKLPDFDLLKKYLGPGGLFVQSEDNGWWLVGCLLKKQ
jgi:hypothetical protein